MAKRKARSEPAAVTNPDEAAFLVAIQKNPADSNVRVAYADWLEEHDRPYEAAVQRDRAGVSEVWYMIRRKTDGMFADPDGPSHWARVGKRWRSLKSLVPHVTNVSYAREGRYLKVKWANLEIVVIEIRPQDVGVLPAVVARHPQYRSIISFTVPEPAPPSVPSEATPPPTQPERRAARRRRR